MNEQRSRAHGEPVSNVDEAHGLADPESIIYESRTSHHFTIITPIAPKILLAVTGSISSREGLAEGEQKNEDATEAPSPTKSPTASPPQLPPEHPSGPNGFLEAPKSLLEELGSISDQLSSVLREEMGQMRWPEGV